MWSPRIFRSSAPKSSVSASVKGLVPEQDERQGTAGCWGLTYRTGPNWHHSRAERIYASLWRSLPSTASPPGDRPVVVDRRPRYHAGFHWEKASCTSRGAWASAAWSAPAGVTWGRWTMTSKASRGLRPE